MLLGNYGLAFQSNVLEEENGCLEEYFFWHTLCQNGFFFSNGENLYKAGFCL